MKKQPPSLRAALDPTPEPQQRWFTLALAGTAAAVLASMFLAVALIGFGWGWALAALVTYIAAGFTARGVHLHLKRAVWVACAVVSGLSLLGAIFGALSTDLVGGKPVASWSIEARVARELTEIDGALRALQRADALLVLDPTTARARLDDISKSRAAMMDLSAAAAGTKASTEVTQSAYQSIAKASDAAAQALEGKLQLAQEYDTRVEAEVSLLRDTLIAEALRAGQLSRQAASIVGIEIGVQE